MFGRVSVARVVVREIRATAGLVERYYLPGGALLVRTNNLATVSYVHGDRLGSTQVITDARGVLQEQRGFDAFGKPRDGDDWGNSNGNKLVDATSLRNRRGFTQHEHIDGFRVVHMNGRTYDFNLGRFYGVDPFIQFPTNSQSLNPYSYIMNNPLAGTDPTGYAAECDDPHNCSISGSDIDHFEKVTLKSGEVVLAAVGNDGSMIRVEEIRIQKWDGQTLESVGVFNANRDSPHSIGDVAARVNLFHPNTTAAGSDMVWETGNRVGKEVATTYGKIAAGGAICGVGAVVCLGAANVNIYWNLWQENYDTALLSGLLTAGGGAVALLRNLPIVPRGFVSRDQFQQAMSELRDALRKSGIADGAVGVRGSSVTGRGFVSRRPFGPDSDIDVFVASDQLTAGLANSRGFAYAGSILRKFPLLRAWSDRWSGILGRKITPAGFTSSSAPQQSATAIRVN